MVMFVTNLILLTAIILFVISGILLSKYSDMYSHVSLGAQLAKIVRGAAATIPFFIARDVLLTMIITRRKLLTVDVALIASSFLFISMIMEYIIVWICITVGFLLPSKRDAYQTSQSRANRSEVETGVVDIGPGEVDTAPPSPNEANATQQHGITEGKTPEAQAELQEATIRAMEKNGVSSPPPEYT
ncbi:MAG: hypothetical protein Q9164_001328 [Protoblastenia rupestris]